MIRWSGDDARDRELLMSEEFERVNNWIGQARYIFIDEAQKIPNIGNMLKLLIDRYKSTKQIIITGSSSFHILTQTSEPLTGRKIVYTLYPLTVGEMIDFSGQDNLRKNLENILLYGMYPDVRSRSTNDEKEVLLRELATSGLYRDILEFQNVRNSYTIEKLIKYLALQIGSEVSYHDIGKQLGMDSRTVERYVDLLEKSFIVYRLPPYFTNKQKELSKMPKIYFYDIGIRNAFL